jgi:hypothetical protein
MNLKTLFTPAITYAQTLTNPVTGNLGSDATGALSGGLFLNYFIKMWRTAINLGALVVLLFYVIAAYEWLTSGSDPKGVDQARQRFMNATIGLLLLVSSFALVAFVGELLFEGEFNLLRLTFPSSLPIPEIPEP